MQSLHNVPMGFQNQAFMVVSQEEKSYQKGNAQKDIKFSDCLPWEDLSKLATQCVNKCLPVILQRFYEEESYVPKCHVGIEHQCMSYTMWQVKYVDPYSF